MDNSIVNTKYKALKPLKYAMHSVHSSHTPPTHTHMLIGVYCTTCTYYFNVFRMHYQRMDHMHPCNK